MKNQIEFAQFLEVEANLEITVGMVVHAEEVPKSKLLKLTVNVGDEADRICLTNIKDELPDGVYQGLVNTQFLFVCNLKPVVMKGIESSLMICPGSKLKESGEILSVPFATPGNRVI